MFGSTLYVSGYAECCDVDSSPPTSAHPYTRMPLRVGFAPNQLFCSGYTVLSFGTPIVGPRKSALGKIGSSGGGSALRNGVASGTGVADGAGVAVGAALAAGTPSGAICADARDAAHAMRARAKKAAPFARPLSVLVM